LLIAGYPSSEGLGFALAGVPLDDAAGEQLLASVRDAGGEVMERSEGDRRFVDVKGEKTVQAVASKGMFAMAAGLPAGRSLAKALQRTDCPRGALLRADGPALARVLGPALAGRGEMLQLLAALAGAGAEIEGLQAFTSLAALSRIEADAEADETGRLRLRARLQVRPVTD
jgi:hypothetical protein